MKPVLIAVLVCHFLLSVAIAEDDCQRENYIIPKTRGFDTQYAYRVRDGNLCQGFFTYPHSVDANKEMEEYFGLFYPIQFDVAEDDTLMVSFEVPEPFRSLALSYKSDGWANEYYSYGCDTQTSSSDSIFLQCRYLRCEDDMGVYSVTVNEIAAQAYTYDSDTRVILHFPPRFEKSDGPPEQSKSNVLRAIVSPREFKLPEGSVVDHYGIKLSYFHESEFIDYPSDVNPIPMTRVDTQKGQPSAISFSFSYQPSELYPIHRLKITAYTADEKESYVHRVFFIGRPG